MNDIYSHTYKGWELLKLYDEEKINENTIIKYTHKNTTDTKTLEEFLNHPHTLYRLTNSGNFKIIKPEVNINPANFEEVLNSDKWIKIEHSLIEEKNICEDFDRLGSWLITLGKHFVDKDIRTILNEAKFYIREE